MRSASKGAAKRPKKPVSIFKAHIERENQSHPFRLQLSIRTLGLAFLLALTIPFTATWAGLSQKEVEQKVKASGVLLVDAQTGRVLFERNSGEPYAPASTVKLLTALVVYEKTGLKGQIRVVESDTRVEPSHVPLQTGEFVSIRDLVSALLIGSDNDCAMALARVINGDRQEFYNLMNSRAKELGCTKTYFRNPNGLPTKGQYTTCRDLMLIFQKAVSYPELRQICQTRYFKLRTRSGAQTIKNHNKLLGSYPGMGPAKTGWTHSSRHTYAASATRNGRELHLTLLNSPNKWADARVLFDYGFTVSGEVVQVKP